MFNFNNHRIPHEILRNMRYVQEHLAPCLWQFAGKCWNTSVSAPPRLPDFCWWLFLFQLLFIFPQSSSNCFRPGLFSGHLSFAQKWKKLPWQHLTAELGHCPAWKSWVFSGPLSASRVRRKRVFNVTLDRYIWSSTCVESSRTLGDQSLPVVSPNFCADWRNFPAAFFITTLVTVDLAQGWPGLRLSATLFSELNFFHHRFMVRVASQIVHCSDSMPHTRLKHANYTATHL